MARNELLFGFLFLNAVVTAEYGYDYTTVVLWLQRQSKLDIPSSGDNPGLYV